MPLLNLGRCWGIGGLCGRRFCFCHPGRGHRADLADADHGAGIGDSGADLIDRAPAGAPLAGDRAPQSGRGKDAIGVLFKLGGAVAVSATAAISAPTQANA